MNYTDLISSIKLAGQGMCALFVVTGTISGLVYLLTKMIRQKKE